MTNVSDGHWQWSNGVLQLIADCNVLAEVFQLERSQMWAYQKRGFLGVARTPEEAQRLAVMLSFRSGEGK